MVPHLLYRFFRSVSYLKQFLRYRKVDLIPNHIPAGGKPPLVFSARLRLDYENFDSAAGEPFLFYPFPLSRGSAQNDVPG